MKMKRAVLALCVTAAAGAVPLVAASTAHADQISCVNYVASHGYTAGPKVRAACNHGAITSVPGTIANPHCLTRLAAINVRLSVANPACLRA